MSSRGSQSSAVPKLLKVREVAALLGVTTRTVQTWIALGRLTPIRLSPRALRVAEPEIDALIRRATPTGSLLTDPTV